MGQPNPGNSGLSCTEYIGVGSERGEVKHLSTPRKRNQFEILLVAASERGRAQTSRSNTIGVVGLLQGQPGELQNQCVVEGFWKGQPKRVIVP